MLFLDCEFNGHKGELISMAIVTTNGDEFYQVAPSIEQYDINEWVKENVVPKLGGKQSIAKSWKEFREELWKFLLLHPNQIIVADSPADFIYLLEQLHYMDENNKYRYISANLKMEFVISGDYLSENPHNAIADARALRDWYLNNLPNIPKMGKLHD